ncbi:hypothetical protein F7018_00955 [Tenacibaculum aiptasiae]|uniref:Uncharacterized protein n=1 Tax=Tenacibaculum aiptasiae TaxID=426481 RepID=A0A7J5AS61_9FLAO|nr:hypothetical protein [Tenacibaculum aiptasiae]KAB1160477.1 hypothetical protein F7018_00955 [Tenacibaculum aiptasiae]
MKQNNSKYIIGYKNLLLGILGLVFSFLFYYLNKESLTTGGIIIMALIGMSSMIYIWDYISPKNKIIGKNTEKAKQIKLDKRKDQFKSLKIELYNKSGFTAIINNKKENIEWNEISQIIIVRENLFIENEVCLYLRIDNLKGFEICETSSYWKDFNDKLIISLKEINKNWLAKFKTEPIEINNIVLYKRKNVA